MGIADKISGKKVSQTRYFKKAENKAFEYVKDSAKLGDLLDKAKKKAEKKSGYLYEVWDYLMISFKMLRAYGKGEYTEIPWKSLVLIIASILYFVMPLDFISDFIPVFGFIDDAALLGWTFKSVKSDLDKFSDLNEQKTI